MEKTSKPVVLEPSHHHHHHHQTQSGENEAESKRQQQPAERVLLVDKPYQTKKKVKPVVEKIKVPKRGLGVAKLEILRLEGKLKQVNEQLEQLQAEKEIIAAAAVPPPPLLLKSHPQHQHQVPFPPFVDPMQQYPNGMIPVPYGRFVPVAGAMNKDGSHHHPHHVSFVFQPMNQNGGYPGEPMQQVIPNGGGFPVGFIPPAHHEPNNMINGNGGGSPGGTHHHHHEPNNNMNGNGGGVNINGGCPNQNIAAGNPYMFLDQQLRVQHLKLMHSARELSAIQRMQYHMPQHSAKFPVENKPVINSEQLPKSDDNKMVMNDTLDSLELSLGSRTNIHGKNQTEDDEEVDAFGGRRRRSTNSVLMEYDFFPGESSESRSSSYAGGGGGMGSSEASSSNENTTHMLDLSLKLSL